VEINFRAFCWLLRRSFLLAYEDGCLGTAKGVAYSALLCFFPLLTATAAILVQAGALPASRVFYRVLSNIVPPGSEASVMETFRASGERPVSLLVAAVLISVWAASRAMTSLIEGFESVYNIPTGRPFLRQQAVAILLVISTAVPVAVALALLLFGTRIEQIVLPWLGVLEGGAHLQAGVVVAAKTTRYIISLAASIAVASVMYFQGPNRPQRWRFVWPGALLATMLWLLSTLGFGWYVRNIASYNVFYGSVAAAIALLVWMYVLALTALIGCEFNAEYERLALLPPHP
jgi:membrane protein